MNGDRFRVIKTPTGDFLLVETDAGEIQTGWKAFGSVELDRARAAPRLLPDLADRLKRYFRGEAVDFRDIPFPKAPPFHAACWRAARTIPRGASVSYLELATLAGNPRAARAAGQAMRRNPQPIITPCHRVIGAGGRLGGFSGTVDDRTDRIQVKKLLLELETRVP